MAPPKKKSGDETAVVLADQKTPAVSGNPDDLISQAIAIGSNIDVLERLMTLRKDMRMEQAKEAFNKAMADFQSECPVIKKTKGVKTKAGKVAYMYAPIEEVIEQVKELIQKHGFRYFVTMELKDGLVKAICRVVHTLGHEEVSNFEVPLGNKTEIMSQSQVVAAASTFAKRYAFLNAFGIMTGDQDTEATEGEKVTTSEMSGEENAAVEKWKQGAEAAAAESKEALMKYGQESARKTKYTDMQKRRIQTIFLSLVKKVSSTPAQ